MQLVPIVAQLIEQLWPYVLIGLAALFGLVGAWRKGKADQKATQAAERLAARDEADKIDQAVAGMSDAEVLKGQARWSRPKS